MEGWGGREQGRKGQAVVVEMTLPQPKKKKKEFICILKFVTESLSHTHQMPSLYLYTQAYTHKSRTTIATTHEPKA